MVTRLDDIDWPSILNRPFHPSPTNWSDEVLYFLLVDRFSDGKEDGYRDVNGAVVAGETPPYGPTDFGNAVGNDDVAAKWRSAGGTWTGGTIAGIRSKLGYLKRLGVTALWISPVLRQRPNTDDYHGYGIQNFLDVDPHYGTADEFRDLVREAHALEIYVILDVVFNHTGDVFGYDADRYDTVDPGTGRHYMDPRWDGRPYQVAGWRNASGDAVLPADQPVPGDHLDDAIWPAELQSMGTFTRHGRINGWDNDPEYREGDFFGYKDVHHGDGVIDTYYASPALLNLITSYSYWIAFADLDGFRIDTVKHMDPGATRLLCSAIKEFAATIGKDSFFLVGEITGSRDFAFDLMQATGLDAALGLGDVQDKLENSVKGWADPQDYFSLFRNSDLVGQGTHTWIGQHVVTSYDDHDQVRKGNNKARFAAAPEGARLAAGALALNTLTLGIPCVYYGSEQAFDGQGTNDRYIREAMFGGAFGAFRSANRHVFDETSPIYVELAAVLALRKADVTLRRGRQYLRAISADGQQFDLPRRIGDRMTSIVAWSRILSRRENLCAINTDLDATRQVWVTVDASLHQVGQEFRYAYSSAPALAGTTTSVAPLNGLAVQISVAPGGIAILVPS
jgi:glycosidase